MGAEGLVEGGVGGVAYHAHDVLQRLVRGAQQPGGPVHAGLDQLFTKAHAAGVLKHTHGLAAGEIHDLGQLLDAGAAVQIGLDVSVDLVQTGGGEAQLLLGLVPVTQADLPQDVQQQGLEQGVLEIFPVGGPVGMEPEKLPDQPDHPRCGIKKGMGGDLPLGGVSQRTFGQVEAEIEPLKVTGQSLHDVVAARGDDHGLSGLHGALIALHIDLGAAGQQNGHLIAVVAVAAVDADVTLPGQSAHIQFQNKACAVDQLFLLLGH